jgi:CO/xanthine dehydrogenase Mo-binding subunit
LSSTPAIAAAIRAATGRAVRRVPVRPEHLVGLGDDGPAI